MGIPVAMKIASLSPGIPDTGYVHILKYIQIAHGRPGLAYLMVKDQSKRKDGLYGYFTDYEKFYAHPMVDGKQYHVTLVLYIDAIVENVYVPALRVSFFFDVSIGEKIKLTVKMSGVVYIL